MSNLATIQNVSEWTAEQLALITNTVAKGASKDELQLFLYRCKEMGLNPLKPGQIHFIKYGTGPGTMVVGIEGFRSIAGRTGKLSGINRGVLQDEKGNLVSAWAEVRRSDWTHPAREEVPFAEYNTGKGPWAKMPQTMLKKVAEAAALRMAFPDSLGGVYESSEMDQAKEAFERKGFVDPGNGIQREGYHFPAIAGSIAMKHIDDVSTDQLMMCVEAIETKYAGKIIPPKTKEVRDTAHQEILKREGVVTENEEGMF